ncbi:hypothetical protein ABFS82_09G008700 [Erythranthe guttata]
MVGKSLVYIDNGTALEIIRRVNIKHESVLSGGSISDMFGMWETISKKKASKMNNITWKVSVDVGFRYLVRLHFSELGFKIADIGGVIFTVSINEMIANIDENSNPWYRDYMVTMKGHKEEGKHDLLICLQSNDEFMNGHGPLKGFEIIKLSNPDDSLASPNPLPSSHDSSYQNLHHILGQRNMIATAAITLLVAVNTIVYISRQFWEASDTVEENKPSDRAKRLCRRFSLDELQLATEDFSESHLIGRGGFGRVYKGLVDNGRKTVAIKRQKLESHQGSREFLTEIETLTELRHVNLVSLIGFCNEHGEMILVYEYMACGTLADQLYKLSRTNHDRHSLTWRQRLTICIGAGRGLDYLHTGHSLIHRDVKASNILLDENFVAKVSDFGLAKYLSTCKLQQSHVSTKVKGTFGYFDPNYFNTGKLTMKSDTYAFGVMLLEVLGGRPAVDPRAGEDEQILTKWARESISNGNLDQIIASNLRGEITDDSLKAFVEVAGRCLHDEPKKRPTMAEVVFQLEFALEQQERLKCVVSNGITCNVDDCHHSDDKTNFSVSTGEMTIASSDVHNLSPSPPKERSNSKVVNAETPSGRKEEDTISKPSRFSLWDAFWNLVKPSEFRAAEAADKSQQIVNMLPIVVPGIPVDELDDKETVNMLPIVAPAIPGDELVAKETVNMLPVVAPAIPGNELVDKQTVNMLPITIPGDELLDKETINMLPIDVPAIPVDELKNITDTFGFQCLVGVGSYGEVYRGVMKNGQDAAFKKLDSSKQNSQEFLAQVSKIYRVKHKNVVELLGYCVDGGLQVLAYEFTRHGSLHEILHEFKYVKGSVVLSWTQRVKIAVGAAKGLEHIHKDSWRQCHGDISSRKILLFDDYDVARIDGFGLSNRARERTYSAIHPRSNGPYCPHEARYTMNGRLSNKSDVYSFGVVLLELLTGRKPIDHSYVSLIVTWHEATPKPVVEEQVQRCVDPRLNGDYPLKAVAKVFDQFVFAD